MDNLCSVCGAACSSIVLGECDNYCGTKHSIPCGCEYYYDNEKKFLVWGHNPKCGISSSEEKD